MRILHVIGTLNPDWGGPVQGVRNITDQAMLRGHEVHIVTLDDPAMAWLSSWKPKVHAIGKCTSLKDYWYRFTPKLDKWLASHLAQFDRVIVHSIWMYFSYAVWRATRRVRVPYYLFIHGALDPWFAKRYPLKHLKKVLYWKLIEHRVVRDAQAVLFTTQEEMNLARNAYLPYRCNPVVIGYGIAPPPDDEHLDDRAVRSVLTQRYPALRGRRYLLLLARIHEKKGIDLLLKAFAECRKLLPETALLIVGAGEANYTHSLQRLTDSLGLSADVVWTGAIYGDDKLRLIRTADAFVLPSHQENFGIGVVESLACSTPVLISDKVNIWREVVGSNAGLVEPNDQAGTSMLLKRWSALSVQDKGRMRIAARSCFYRHFDMSVACERLFSVVLNENTSAAEPPNGRYVTASK